MTDLREAAIRVLQARENAQECREDVRKLEQQHAALYAQRHEAIAAEAQAEADAKAARLAHFTETGEKGDIYGLSISMREVMEYDDLDALRWLVGVAYGVVTGHVDAAASPGWGWVRDSLREPVGRRAFERIAKAVGLPFLRYRREPAPLIAHDSLAAKVKASADIEARGPEIANDVLADLAARETGH